MDLEKISDFLGETEKALVSCLKAGEEKEGDSHSRQTKFQAEKW